MLTTRWMPELERLAALAQHRCLRGEGAGLVLACSNDTLGLRHHPALVAAANRATSEGCGVGASRLLGGNHPLYESLEAALAAGKGTEAALVFPSGYQCNSSVLATLCRAGDVIVADRLNHASLVAGCLASGATLLRYRHLDLADAERQLQKAQERLAPQGQCWLVSDSLFSMDGDWPDLVAWCDLADAYGAATYLDEAHASGIFGASGEGLASHYGVSARISVQMGTFSKALGGLGGFVATSALLKDVLVNRCGGLIYTTGLPPSVLASNLAAVQLVQSEEGEALRARLWQHIEALQQGWPSVWQSALPQSPIASVPLPASGRLSENAAALHRGEALRTQWGIEVGIVRPPTVPAGQARLRLTLSARHRAEEVATLINALNWLSEH